MDIADAARARATPASPAAARAGALALALGVVLLGAGGLLFQATLPSRLPRPSDWRDAAALIARGARPGDAVALSPWWAERGREVLPPEVPLLALPSLGDDDLLGVRRVWLVAMPRTPGRRGDAAADLARRAAAIDGPRRLGALEVTRYDLAAPTLPIAFLPDALAAARVTVGGRPCLPGARGEVRCPGGATLQREVREVDVWPRACLRARPSGDPSAPLAVTFPSVRLGRRLRGHAGVVGEAALGGDAPVRLVARIDGREVGGVEVAPGDPGWRAFEVDTSGEAGRDVAVRLEVAAPRGDERPLCFDAFTLP